MTLLLSIQILNQFKSRKMTIKGKSTDSVLIASVIQWLLISAETLTGRMLDFESSRVNIQEYLPLIHRDRSNDYDSNYDY